MESPSLETTDVVWFRRMPTGGTVYVVERPTGGGRD